MTARDILNRFRIDMEMTDIEYINFCKRYATRNISTVIWYLSKLYGKLPKGIDETIIRTELSEANVIDKEHIFVV